MIDMLLRRRRGARGSVDAIRRLQAIASAHAGDVRILRLSKHDTTTLARVEWIDQEKRRSGDPRFIVGGEARGETPELAARQLLLNLRSCGLA